MIKNFNRWIALANIAIAFIVMALGIVQYKIAQYNTRIGELNEQINGKVTSSLFVNFQLIIEHIESLERNAFLLHNKLGEAKIKEEQILSQRSEILINYLEIAELSTDELKQTIAQITNNSNTPFQRKYQELRTLYDKYQGSIQLFFGEKYQEKRSTQKKLNRAYLIQIMAIAALFILSASVSLLAFKNKKTIKNEETTKDARVKKRK